MRFRHSESDGGYARSFCRRPNQSAGLGGTNAPSSFADSHALAEGLEKLDLVVCHDLSSDTIREYADVVLPGTAWVEQLGCKMTHTHLYLMEKVLEPPPQCGSTTQIFKDPQTWPS